jgi:hypothetical protein
MTSRKLIRGYRGVVKQKETGQNSVRFTIVFNPIYIYKNNEPKTIKSSNFYLKNFFDVLAQSKQPIDFDHDQFKIKIYMRIPSQGQVKVFDPNTTIDLLIDNSSFNFEQSSFVAERNDDCDIKEDDEILFLFYRVNGSEEQLLYYPPIQRFVPMTDAFYASVNDYYQGRARLRFDEYFPDKKYTCEEAIYVINHPKEFTFFEPENPKAYFDNDFTNSPDVELKTQIFNGTTISEPFIYYPIFNSSATYVSANQLRTNKTDYSLDELKNNPAGIIYKISGQFYRMCTFVKNVELIEDEQYLLFTLSDQIPINNAESYALCVYDLVNNIICTINNSQFNLLEFIHNELDEPYRGYGAVPAADIFNLRCDSQKLGSMKATNRVRIVTFCPTEIFEAIHSNEPDGKNPRVFADCKLSTINHAYDIENEPSDNSTEPFYETQIIWHYNRKNNNLNDIIKENDNYFVTNLGYYSRREDET